MDHRRDPDELEFVLFAKEPAYVRRALDAGIESFMIDWEYLGKGERQLDRDTEINRDSPEDLARLDELACPRRYCRVNAMGGGTEREVEQAVGAGARWRLAPAFPRLSFLWSGLESWPMLARHSNNTRRISPEGSRIKT